MLSVQGLSHSTYSEAVTPPSVLFAAEFSRRTNQRELIHAAAILYARAVFVPLTLVGSGQPRIRTSTQELAHALGLQQQIRWIDTAEPSLHQLREHPVCVISHLDATRSLINKAQAAGCELLVINHRDLAPGAYGSNVQLIPPQDAPALANALEDRLRQAIHHRPWSQALSA